jgi:hypothetical protein
MKALLTLITASLAPSACASPTEPKVDEAAAAARPSLPRRASRQLRRALSRRTSSPRTEACRSACRSSPLFRDRHAAGLALVPLVNDAIAAARGLGHAPVDSPSSAVDDVIVLGMARGGVAVAAPIARALAAPLEVFVGRKLGVLGVDEVAFGAIAAGGLCAGVGRRARVHRHSASGRALGLHARTRRARATGPALSRWCAAAVAHGTHRRAGGRRARERCDPSRGGHGAANVDGVRAHAAVRHRISQIDVLRLPTIRNNPLIATCTMPYTTMAMMIGNTSVLPASVLGLPTMPRNGA